MSSLNPVASRQSPFAFNGSPAGSHAARQLSGLVTAHLQSRDGGALLRMEGEKSGSVYFVLSGWLAVSKSTPDGNRLISDVVLSGNVMDPATASADISAVEIEALTDVTYAAIPRAKWLRGVEQSAELRELTQQQSGATIARMSERMLRMGKSDAESIIAYALCEMALRSTGRAMQDIGSFHLPMTQQQLGDFCGLSSVHICRTLQRLRRGGMLDVRNHMDITIHDVEGLAQIAQIDPDSLRSAIMPKVTLAQPAWQGQAPTAQSA